MLMKPSNGQNYIPIRFSEKIKSHILRVCLDLPAQYQTPLILGIQGPAGIGKTYQTRCVLAEMGVVYMALDSAFLSGELEGDSIKTLKSAYIELGNRNNKLTAIIIDDFDISIASIKKNFERTSNSDILNSFLMHLCDAPKEVDGEKLFSVPIIITGNNFKDLYSPLIRHGRADLFEWLPTKEEKYQIINGILSECRITEKTMRHLLEKYPDKSMAFFQQIKSNLIEKEIHELYHLTQVINFDRQDFGNKGLVRIKNTITSATDDEIVAIAEKINTLAGSYL